jgi:hypothetical protein
MPPRNSPLWGRYSELLRQLTGPWAEAQSFNAEVREIYEEFASIRVAEAWRADMRRAASTRGDDPRRWDRLVPQGCARGEHRWRRPDYWGAQRCADCDVLYEPEP